MRQYLNLLQDVLDNGQRESNRTGIDTLTLPGAMLKFDLRKGFPIVTTKKLAFNAVKGELIGFLRGCTSAAEFCALGCSVWNKNANEHNVDMAGKHVENKWLSSPFRQGDDDLGRLGYSHGWRHFGGTRENGVANNGIDQIAIALDQVRYNPESRRILVSAWNPTELHMAALPPCHVMFQLLPRSDGTLHMTAYMRSADMFLGVPFNIASYALLLSLFAAWSGRRAATLTMFYADAHIYVNHLDQVKEQISRSTLDLPMLSIGIPENHTTASLDELLAQLQPDHIKLHDYEHHSAIKGDMAG